MKKAAEKLAHPKREYRKELVAKLEMVLDELKTFMTEEEFQHRLKKAAKILTQGLHGKDFSKNEKPVHANIKHASKDVKAIPKKAAAPKKVNTKKAAAK